MSYSKKKGDMFASNAPALAHGCNCHGMMGAGVAYHIAKNFPQVNDEYMELCSTGQFKPGGFYRAQPSIGGGRYIYNLATQVTGGADARLNLIEDSVSAMLEDAEGEGIKEIAMPRIGAGIGGLDWRDVENVIKPWAKASKVKLTVYTLPGPTFSERVNAAWRAFKAQ